PPFAVAVCPNLEATKSPATPRATPLNVALTRTTFKTPRRHEKRRHHCHSVALRFPGSRRRLFLRDRGQRRRDATFVQLRVLACTRLCRAQSHRAGVRTSGVGRPQGAAIG